MITSLNKELEGSDMGGKMLLVGSLDVKALYPSLKIEKTCEIVGNMVLQSEITFEVDKDSLGRYIRLAESSESIKEQGVDHLCPTRMVRRGAVPSLRSKKYVETRGLGPNQSELDLWTAPTKPPETSGEVRKLMAMALKAAIKVFMSNHAYRFRGDIKVQTEGGSIGASLTVQLSRVVMRWFDLEFARGVAIEMKEI